MLFDSHLRIRPVAICLNVEPLCRITSPCVQHNVTKRRLATSSPREPRTIGKRI